MKFEIEVPDSLVGTDLSRPSPEVHEFFFALRAFMLFLNQNFFVYPTGSGPRIPFVSAVIRSGPQTVWCSNYEDEHPFYLQESPTNPDNALRMDPDQGWNWAAMRLCRAIPLPEGRMRHDATLTLFVEDFINGHAWVVLEEVVETITRNSEQTSTFISRIQPVLDFLSTKTPAKPSA